MWDTYVTIQRPEGTQLTGIDGRSAQHLPVQVQQMSESQVVNAKQAYELIGPLYLFKIITLGWFSTSLIVQEDILIDEIYDDPDTTVNLGVATKYKYRVVARPKNFPYDHQEVLCNVIVGN
jgi:hypothetical protein